MTQVPSSPQPSQTPAAPKSGGVGGITPGYLMTVGALAVLIIALLAALWMKERTGRIRAEGDAVQAMRQLDQMKGLLPQLLAAQSPSGEASPQPVQRQDLLPRPVEIDGRPRPAFTISPQAGRRLGFEPGDVILVAAATSQPATARE